MARLTLIFVCLGFLASCGTPAQKRAKPRRRTPAQTSPEAGINLSKAKPTLAQQICTELTETIQKSSAPLILSEDDFAASVGTHITLIYTSRVSEEFFADKNGVLIQFGKSTGLVDYKPSERSIRLITGHNTKSLDKCGQAFAMDSEGISFFYEASMLSKELAESDKSKNRELHFRASSKREGFLNVIFPIEKIASPTLSSRETAAMLVPSGALRPPYSAPSE